ncbi:MAG: MoxR family ATPase [Planctomycetota bacterium]|nr:MoxR family ATPase [Planctomycetota bacterium]
MADPASPEPGTAAPPGGGASDNETAQLLRESSEQLRKELSKVVVGQHEVIEQMLIAMFCGGHSILIGVPGLAKTLLVSTLARLLNLSFRRIQFTPDLMPSDITGTDILQEDPDSGLRSFRFMKGPIFANMLLADEINRTPPKTQAALLEAMQERNVTVGQQSVALPAPFFVVATQNPIEQEGTYNLPEAQLDRFIFSIQVGYPAEEEELEIMKRTRAPESIELSPVLSEEDIIRIQALVPGVPAADHVYRFALKLVRRSRPEENDAPDYIRESLSFGAGPRAAQYLMAAAKARALLHGRFHVNLADIARIAAPVLCHRLITNFNADAEVITAQILVSMLLEDLTREDTGD